VRYQTKRRWFWALAYATSVLRIRRRGVLFTLAASCCAAAIYSLTVQRIYSARAILYTPYGGRFWCLTCDPGPYNFVVSDGVEILSWHQIEHEARKACTNYHRYTGRSAFVYQLNAEGGYNRVEH
jgi:hypothetical protein